MFPFTKMSQTLFRLTWKTVTVCKQKNVCTMKTGLIVLCLCHFLSCVRVFFLCVRCDNVRATTCQAERSLNMYSVLPYFLSKMIAELPISALFPNIFGVILYQMTGLHPKRDR